MLFLVIQCRLALSYLGLAQTRIFQKYSKNVSSSEKSLAGLERSYSVSQMSQSFPGCSHCCLVKGLRIMAQPLNQESVGTLKRLQWDTSKNAKNIAPRITHDITCKGQYHCLNHVTRHSGQTSLNQKKALLNFSWKARNGFWSSIAAAQMFRSSYRAAAIIKCTLIYLVNALPIYLTFMKRYSIGPSSSGPQHTHLVPKGVNIVMLSINHLFWL